MSYLIPFHTGPAGLLSPRPQLEREPYGVVLAGDLGSHAPYFSIQ